MLIRTGWFSAHVVAASDGRRRSQTNRQGIDPAEVQGCWCRLPHDWWAQRLWTAALHFFSSSIVTDEDGTTLYDRHFLCVTFTRPPALLVMQLSTRCHRLDFFLLLLWTRRRQVDKRWRFVWIEPFSSGTWGVRWGLWFHFGDCTFWQSIISSYQLDTDF